MSIFDIGNNIDNAIKESYIINEKDIYYNKDKFDNGEINLCFITGHSGSGKSTLGRDMSKNNTEHYDLDDLQTIKDYFTMDQLKEYGDLIYSYFNGPGKKFYLTLDEVNEKNLSGSEYMDKLYPEFVHYAMKYAKLHKDRKFVLEGIWFFCKGENGVDWFNPEEFKDYAFYIKGTSMLISKYRAAKRDCSDADNKKEERKAFLKIFKKNWKYYFLDEKAIKRFRDYFKKLEKSSVNESAILESSDRVSHIDPNFKKKSGKSFSYIDINSPRADKYLEQTKDTKRLSKDIHDKYIGEIAICGDEFAGYIIVGDKKDKGFIATLSVEDKYQGYGISNQLLKDAINKYGAIDLLVSKKNEVAIRLYEKFGFVKIKYNSKDEYWMKLKSKLSKDDEVLNEAVTEDTLKMVKDFNKDLNKWKYGVLVNGKVITKSSEIDWDNYRTIKISDIEKYHVGICWDFVNYQSYWFNKNHIDNRAYFFVMSRNESNTDIVTHTFNIININFCSFF